MLQEIFKVESERVLKEAKAINMKRLYSLSKILTNEEMKDYLKSLSRGL